MDLLRRGAGKPHFYSLSAVAGEFPFFTRSPHMEVENERKH